MIVKNEESVLRRCLESVRGIFDEIIIVDTGSTDRTKQIAKKFTANVYDFIWIDDFAVARNFSFSNATKDFIMWLDADDIIDDVNKKKILDLKSRLDLNVDMVTMKYDLGGGIFSTRERIFNRLKNFKWNGCIHEYIPISHTALHLDAFITHKPPKRESHTERNLGIFEKQLSKGELTPREQFYYARELFNLNRHKDAIKYFNLFLSGGQGWIEDNISACLDIAKCYNILGDKTSELQYLLKSLEYDAPRPEACCMIGYFYKLQNKFSLASNWFETALSLPARKSLGFVNTDFSGYIPAIELAVCYDKIGDYTTANHFNNRAGQFKPNSAQYIANRNYFTARGII